MIKLSCYVVRLHDGDDLRQLAASSTCSQFTILSSLRTAKKNKDLRNRRDLSHRSRLTGALFDLLVRKSSLKSQQVWNSSLEILKASQASTLLKLVRCPGLVPTSRCLVSESASHKTFAAAPTSLRSLTGRALTSMCQHRCEDCCSVVDSELKTSASVLRV